MPILSVFFIASGARSIHMKIKWQGFLPFPVEIGAIPKIRFQQGAGFYTLLSFAFGKILAWVLAERHWTWLRTDLASVRKAMTALFH